MRRLGSFVAAVLSLVVASAVQAGSLREKFDAAAATSDDGAVERVLAEWKSAEPQNPEIYVAAGNYFFSKAGWEHLELSTRPPGGEDLTVVDPTLGVIVGSAATITDYHPDVAARAVAALTEGARRFPERLDIWFGLAHVQQELGDFEEQYATVSGALRYATSHNARTLKWIGGAPLPSNPVRFVPETAQGYLLHYYELETPEGDERFLRLARLVMKYYPLHPYPVNSIGTYFACKQRWVEARSFFEKAHQLDPSDSLVSMNLAEIFVRLNDTERARALFDEVVRSTTDEEVRDGARQRLNDLGQ